MISRFSWVRHIVLPAVASVAIYGGACSSDTHGTGGGGASDLAGVIYQGSATDEALGVLLAAGEVANPTSVAVFDMPLEGAQIPASPIPTFAWHVESVKAATAPVARPRSRWAALDVFAISPNVSFGPLMDLVGSPRSASAHGGELEGLAYYLLFSTAADDKLLRVFTTETTYTPDAAAWAKITGAKGTIQAWILTGTFIHGALAEGGGPFRGPWIGFAVAP